MRKLVLRNFLSPGDIVMLTAAVRDLHQCYPRQFLTDVETSCPELWEHNPYITPLDESDREVETIECHYPLINRCNTAPYHCLHGFIEFLNDRLGLAIKPTVFKGDIHLSRKEKSWCSQVQELTGEDTPFWIIAAGGKWDVTIKWWEAQRYQEVVDHFRGKIQFVQVGEADHFHPQLSDVIDLRGKTTLRELVRLVYNAQGVLCPVTALMHLAAAVEMRDCYLPNRPCVVVAGGREPVHWEAYPFHQFIHTIGALSCCSSGGCWKARVAPLGDGDPRDRPENLCSDPVGYLPRCMDMITSDEVTRRISTYFDGGAFEYLTPRQYKTARRCCVPRVNPPETPRLTPHTALEAETAFLRTIRLPKRPWIGRGIVICAGGLRYFPNAWVCIRRLRALGCNLPVQLWHLGEEELDAEMNRMVAPFDVECIDAEIVRRKHPARILRGWELKPYAILHSPFRQVLLLDADNVPVVDPTFLFDTPQFKQTGAIFWPDYDCLEPSNPVWRICGVPYRDEAEFETGQILVDKQKCWKSLSLCMWYNEHSDFYYDFTKGDKETFHMAFRRLNKSYSMPKYSIHSLSGTMCQHDFKGNRIFQHRNQAKWQLDSSNRRVEDFWFEKECLADLALLRARWNTRMPRRSVRPHSQ